MTKAAVFDHGKMCESGIAIRFSLDLAICITIESTSLSNERDDASRYSFDEIECPSFGSLTYC
jgi:hypothetical protein